LAVGKANEADLKNIAGARAARESHDSASTDRCNITVNQCIALAVGKANEADLKNIAGARAARESHDSVSMDRCAVVSAGAVVRSCRAVGLSLADVNRKGVR
jgi:hypothetical protein